MIFFVIFFSFLSTYLIVFFGSAYIAEIKTSNVINLSVFITALKNTKVAQQKKHRNTLLFLVINSMALFLLQAELIWLPEQPFFNLFFSFIWLTILSLLAKIDFYTGYLPNTLTYFLWLSGCMVLWLTIGTEGWNTIFYSLCLVASGQLLQFLSHRLIGQSLIGMGDIKWFAGIWLWMGSSFLVTLMLLASVLFLIFHKDKKKNLRTYPFGLFIFFGVIGAHLLYAI